MDTSEVKVKASELKQNIRDLLAKFQLETGCVPEVRIGFHRLSELDGRTVRIPSVDIDVVL